MQLKDWAYLGNYEFFTGKLKLLAANELPAEKWSYSGKDGNIEELSELHF